MPSRGPPALLEPRRLRAGHRGTSSDRARSAPRSIAVWVPDDMTMFGRMRAIRISPIGSWGQRAYEEDIVQGRFFGRSTFILNAPDAIKHVLVDNYENYTRTPVGIRVLRPILGEGLLIAEGRAWKHQRRTLAPVSSMSR